MSEDDNFVIRAADVSFRRDAEGRVLLVRNGAIQAMGSIMAAFPLTRRGRMIALRDEEGREIGILDHVGSLDPDSRTILRQELERSYFMPRILDILDIGEELNVATWDVETDRGPRVFQVRSVRQNVRRIGSRRFVVKDVDGNRYEIRDWSELPVPAQNLIEIYL